MLEGIVPRPIVAIANALAEESFLCRYSPVSNVGIKNRRVQIRPLDEDDGHSIT